MLFGKSEKLITLIGINVRRREFCILILEIFGFQDFVSWERLLPSDMADLIFRLQSERNDYQIRPYKISVEDNVMNY